MSNMDKRNTGASQVPGKDRLKLAATAMASNKKLHATGGSGDTGAWGSFDGEVAKSIIEGWPKTAKMAAENTMKFYGPPNEATPTQLIWYENGPWKRTIAFRDEVPHDFPEPHIDVLQQFIDYQVPADRMGDLAQLEGSIVVDRTKGEVSVHCDNEGANTLSLNMMHEVVTGKRTPQEARDFITKELVEYLMDRPAPYAENFQFDLPQGPQWFTDTSVVQDKMLEEAVGKVSKKLGLDK